MESHEQSALRALRVWALQQQADRCSRESLRLTCSALAVCPFASAARVGHEDVRLFQQACGRHRALPLHLYIVEPQSLAAVSCLLLALQQLSGRQGLQTLELVLDGAWGGPGGAPAHREALQGVIQSAGPQLRHLKLTTAEGNPPQHVWDLLWDEQLCGGVRGVPHLTFASRGATQAAQSAARLMDRIASSASSAHSGNGQLMEEAARLERLARLQVVELPAADSGAQGASAWPLLDVCFPPAPSIPDEPTSSESSGPQRGAAGSAHARAWQASAVTLGLDDNSAWCVRGQQRQPQLAGCTHLTLVPSTSTQQADDQEQRQQRPPAIPLGRLLPAFAPHLRHLSLEGPSAWLVACVRALELASSAASDSSPSRRAGGAGGGGAGVAGLLQGLAGLRLVEWREPTRVEGRHGTRLPVNGREPASSSSSSCSSPSSSRGSACSSPLACSPCSSGSARGRWSPPHPAPEDGLPGLAEHLSWGALPRLLDARVLPNVESLVIRCSQPPATRLKLACLARLTTLRHLEFTIDAPGAPADQGAVKTPPADKVGMANGPGPQVLTHSSSAPASALMGCRPSPAASTTLNLAWLPEALEALVCGGQGVALVGQAPSGCMVHLRDA